MREIVSEDMRNSMTAYQPSTFMESEDVRNSMTAYQPSDFMEKEGVAPLETLAAGEGSKKVAVADKWRAELDTSAPFESVKEAVNRFGGSAVWKSQLKGLFNTSKHHFVEEIEFMNVQEQSAQLEKVLIAEERETVKVLSELEMTKKIINCLESRLYEESYKANKFSETRSENVKQSPGSILFNLKQAKMNLMKTRSYLDDIQALVESFNVKVAEEKSLLEKSHEKLSSKQNVVSSLEEELKHLILKLQLTKETKAAKSEVLRLTSEIEQTKATIKASELAQSKARDSVVVLSFEEYAALTQRVREADEASSKKVKMAMVEVERANQSKLELMVKIEEAVEDVKTSRKVLEDALNRVESANKRKLAVEEALRRLRSEDYLTYDSRNKMKHTLSIGEILGRKLMGPDDYDYDIGIYDRTDHGRATVSLGQIINRRNMILSSRNGGGSTKKMIKSLLTKTDFCSKVILD